MLPYYTSFPIFISPPTNTKTPIHQASNECFIRNRKPQYLITHQAHRDPAIPSRKSQRNRALFARLPQIAAHPKYSRAFKESSLAYARVPSPHRSPNRTTILGIPRLDNVATTRAPYLLIPQRDFPQLSPLASELLQPRARASKLYLRHPLYTKRPYIYTRNFPISVCPSLSLFASLVLSSSPCSRAIVRARAISHFLRYAREKFSS